MTMTNPQQIAAQIATMRERLASAAQRVGRDPAAVTLIAVTKTHPPAAVLAALAANITDMGENRVQEAVEKAAQLEAEQATLRWHLIGHLQRNKAKQAAALFAMIHSLDSLRLAETLSHHAQELRSTPLPVLLQVNVSGEASKEGFDLPGGVEHEALPQFREQVAQIATLPGIRIEGLMTIAPIVAVPEQARPVFRALRLLRDDLAATLPGLALHQLSMGMSDDAEVAVEEGATMVRLGRAVFGTRG